MNVHVIVYQFIVGRHLCKPDVSTIQNSYIASYMEDSHFAKIAAH